MGRAGQSSCVSTAPSTRAQPAGAAWQGTGFSLPAAMLLWFCIPGDCPKSFVSLEWEFELLMLTVSWVLPGLERLLCASNALAWRGASNELVERGRTLQPSWCLTVPSCPPQSTSLAEGGNGDSAVALPGQSIPRRHPAAGGRETPPQDAPSGRSPTTPSLPPCLSSLSSPAPTSLLAQRAGSHPPRQCHIRSGARQDKHLGCSARDCSGEERQSRRKRSVRS